MKKQEVLTSLNNKNRSANLQLPYNIALNNLIYLPSSNEVGEIVDEFLWDYIILTGVVMGEERFSHNKRQA